MVYAITPNRVGLAVPADPAKQNKSDKMCIMLDDLYRKHYAKNTTLRKINKLSKTYSS